MFYTYLWLREDGTPYYVGKGKGDRARVKESHRLCPPSKDRIVIYPAESEVDAFETEIALIWYYGRKDLGIGCLRNLTDGGENPPNQKGKPRTKETRRKIGIGNVRGVCKRGHPRTPDNLWGRHCKTCGRMLNTSQKHRDARNLRRRQQL